mgnify:FL=1
MLALPTSVRIYLSTFPVDMRKGCYTLSAFVRASGLDVYSGHLFVFFSKDRTRAKILTWEHGGFVLYYKMLEKGRFRLPAFQEGQPTVLLEPAELAMLLNGFDYTQSKRPRLWTPPKKT